MGEVIRKDASVEDILSDVRTTLTRATVRGGVWKDLAEARLGPVLMAVQATEAKVETALEKETPAVAKRDLAVVEAGNLIGKVSDSLWNAVGRPQNDTFLSLLFPGGISWYTTGEKAGLPLRMGILVELLRSMTHPQLGQAVLGAAADEVEASMLALVPIVKEAAIAHADVERLDRVRMVLVRSAQVELAALKRMYKAHGLREAEIHDVIPHHARSTAKAPEQTERPK